MDGRLGYRREIVLADRSFFFCAGWIADRFGRRKGVALGSVFALLGSALMSGSVNSDMVS